MSHSAVIILDLKRSGFLSKLGFSKVKQTVFIFLQNLAILKRKKQSKVVMPIIKKENEECGYKNVAYQT
jgi:hypothetical protein